MSLDQLQILYASRCNGKATCFQHKGQPAVLSAGTGEEAFKFPFGHFCGDTLVKIIKVNSTASD